MCENVAITLRRDEHRGLSVAIQTRNKKLIVRHGIRSCQIAAKIEASSRRSETATLTLATGKGIYYKGP